MPGSGVCRGRRGVCQASVWLLPPARRRAWFWLSATVLACAVTSPGARPNLLIFPSTFCSFFVAEMLAAYHRRGAAGPSRCRGRPTDRPWSGVGEQTRAAQSPSLVGRTALSRLAVRGANPERHDPSRPRARHRKADSAGLACTTRRRTSPAGRRTCDVAGVGFRDDGDAFLPSREFLEHPFLIWIAPFRSRSSWAPPEFRRSR
jgi:hypothetical protein